MTDAVRELHERTVPEGFIPITEATILTGLSRYKLLAAAAHGEIEAVKVGSWWHVKLPARLLARA